MANSQDTLKQDIINKNEQLNKARQTLKQEFVGIDNIIDEVIESVSSWFFFPDLQEKPVVINLWGLTGVGKSSLVRRLSGLLSFHNKYYQFDLGDAFNKGQSIADQLEYVFGNVNGFPIMVALDEFQYVRSIDNYGVEINRSTSRVIWELLDSGKYQMPEYNYEVGAVFRLMKKLERQLKNGVKVENGRVVSSQKSFIEHLWADEEDLPRIFRSRKPKAKKLFFVKSYYYDIIYTLAKEMFESALDVKEKLLGMNGPETIKFLNEIYEIGNSPKVIDCSKAVIFVIGNLDEAYKMSDNFSADFSADEFHFESAKINISDVKEALKRRFRNEQIARLGNNHIIYPSLNNKSFKKIIDLELQRIGTKFKESQNIELGFGKSLVQLIFDEGVFPTQGVRPLHSTIHQLVQSKLGLIVSEVQLRKLEIDKVEMETEDNILKINFLKDEVVIHTMTEHLKLRLAELRKDKKDDAQAISAVHESGHAIISAILLKTMAEVIYSQSTDYDAMAFIYTKFKNKFLQKGELVGRIAINLGGIVAERIVFGDENITTGSASDIETATYLATTMLKESGMGKTIAAYQVADKETNDYLFDNEDKINSEAKELLQRGMLLAEQTLKEQKVLLLRMADYLCDKRKMDKATIIDFVKKHAVDFDFATIEQEKKTKYYRESLKSQVAELDKTDEFTIAGFQVSLNKSSENHAKLIGKNKGKGKQGLI